MIFLVTHCKLAHKDFIFHCSVVSYYVHQQREHISLNHHVYFAHRIRYITKVKVDRWLLKYLFRNFFYVNNTSFFSIGIYFFYFISNNNCRLLTTVQVFDIMFDNSAPPSFHFISNILLINQIGLDNRLCLYKSSPTTRWNHLNTIYIRHRAIYPSCIHAIHLNYQA